MERKKVLFLISRFLDGGIDTVLVEVLRMLAEDEQRYDITLAIAVRMDGLEVFHDRLPQRIKVEYLVSSPWLCKTKIRRFRKQSTPIEKDLDEIVINPIRRSLQSSRIHRLAKSHDVIVDFDACHTAFLKNCGKPTVAWLHFSPKSMLEQNSRRTMRIARRLKQYDHVVTICKAMQDEARQVFPELSAKTTCIYNALDVDALLKRAAEKAECPFPYLLAVERLEESQKDIRTLLKAYSMLNVPEHLVIIGKGSDEAMLKKYATELGLAHSSRLDGTARVHFIGFKPNPHAWMSNARMIVHSAKFEGLPTVLIEAMLLGVPIVSADCPTGPREILDEGRAGLLVPIGDSDAMAAAISRLLADDALRSECLADAAMHSKLFTKDTVKPQLDKLLCGKPED